MLAETKTRRRIRSRPPRRSHANPQSSAHLQLPSSCLAGAADPATRSAYGLPGRGRSPQAQERKSGPWSQQNGPGTDPSSGRTWDPLEEHSSQRAADSPGHAPPSSRHLEGLRPARKRRSPQGQENKSGHAGSAGQPRDRSPSSGSLGPIGGEYYNHRAADGPPQQFPALPCIGSLTALEILPNPQSSALL